MSSGARDKTYMNAQPGLLRGVTDDMACADFFGAFPKLRSWLINNKAQIKKSRSSTNLRSILISHYLQKCYPAAFWVITSIDWLPFWPWNIGPSFLILPRHHLQNMAEAVRTLLLILWWTETKQFLQRILLIIPLLVFQHLANHLTHPTTCNPHDLFVHQILPLLL